jgi:hypothetical protein
MLRNTLSATYQFKKSLGQVEEFVNDKRFVKDQKNEEQQSVTEKQEEEQYLIRMKNDTEVQNIIKSITAQSDEFICDPLKDTKKYRK